MIIARYAVGDEICYGEQISPTHWRRLEGVPFERIVPTATVDADADVRLLCPVERPRIFGVGFNYAAHARETGHALPTRPATFMKPDSAAIGPGEAIIYPAEGQRVDYECELAVIIGRGGRRIAPGDADRHVFGFTCANDVSERPIQFAEMEAGCLLVGKGFDTFCPLGPVIATGLNHRALAISTRLNGELRQSSNTADLVFDVRFLDNPHFVEELRPLTGRDPAVSQFVLGQQDCQRYLERLRQLLLFQVPRCEQEGKSTLTVAVGCTGGRHRSVAIVEELRPYLLGTGCAVDVSHRDIAQGGA